jgi:phage-related tail fiber protein
MIARRISALVLVLSVAGCGGSEEAVSPIITITDNWTDTANANHTFQFTATTDDTERTGAFDGEERIGGDTYDLSGTWAAGYVVFVVQRATAVRYTARVTDDNPTRLEFESSAGDLTLTRGS